MHVSRGCASRVSPPLALLLVRVAPCLPLGPSRGLSVVGCELVSLGACFGVVV